MRIPLTRLSEVTVNLIKNNNFLTFEDKIQAKTLNMLETLYSQFNSAESFVNNLNIQSRIKSLQIKSPEDVPKPNDFSYITKLIRENILEESKHAYYITIILFNRNITLNVITQKDEDPYLYFYKILVWLSVVIQYNTDQSCSEDLSVFIYLTPFLKLLPEDSDEILSKIHVNTAYTTSCTIKSNIVVFRKEEWCKVFIHETIHNLGLDFSRMDNEFTKNLILEFIPVKSDVKLYEAYTDSWAKILNVVMISYFKDNTAFEIFLNNFNILINIEISHCFFQAVKILEFMKLSYENLFKMDQRSVYLRDTFYQEKSAVLAYYILTAVILNNYQEFIEWCFKNNINLLQFDNRPEKLQKFCIFIKKRFKSSHMLENIKYTEKLLGIFKNNSSDNNLVKYMLRNVRKTICEIE